MCSGHTYWGALWYQLAAFWAAVAVCSLGFFRCCSLDREPSGDLANRLLRTHCAAIIGHPAAAAGAFVLITLFRQVSGDKKMELWGLKLEGAAGPLIFLGALFLGNGIGDQDGLADEVLGV